MMNIPFTQFLLASTVAAIIGVSTLLLGTTILSAPVSVQLEPAEGTLVVGETFVANVTIDSALPVNVFRGLLVFDSEKLTVQSIDYNTSIADLWAEEPWYSNGEGTINFTGGTTAPGGFVGEGTLITITFTAKNIGEASVAMQEMKVLQHDGLGTEAAVTIPVEALFAVETNTLAESTLFDAEIDGPTVIVLPQKPNRDLNNDGRQNIADISIFMTDVLSKNLRSDMNGDGEVTLADLSILTQ